MLAAIVDSSDDAIISKTLDAIITSWNAGARRLFGHTAEEVIGKPIALIIPADRRDEERVILSRLRNGERIDHFETIRQAKDGRLIDISLTIAPIRNDAGKIVGASKVARDITAQKLIHRQLEFLALLAHELRNPLGPIRHAVKILRARTPSPDELRWATSIIDRQTEHLTRLVEDLLDVSQITRGKIELRREPVDLSATLKAAVAASGARIDKAHHILKVTVPHEPLVVDGDPTRLTQVVTNLLDNSAKYTDPGGKIWLSAEREGETAVIRVRDNGMGIAPEVLPRIFDMFTHAELPLERSQGGLGVGLPLVDQLVKLHGGTVAVQSPGHGMGSEFTIRLPVAAKAQKPAVETVKSPPRESHCRVLVVDDNQDSADSLAMLLEMLGHEVQTANDGEAALRTASSFKPGVAILDIGPPKMNGYDLARRIREQPWGKDTVLVALTGWGLQEHRGRSAESGFNHHLTKPVEFDALQPILADADSCLPKDKIATR